MVVPHLMDVIPWAFLLGVPGGASSNGLNSKNLGDVIPRRSRGGASCKDVILRRPRGDASLLGRNSIVWWWCLIVCIRIVKSKSPKWFGYIMCG
ncbi:hypothetical protein DEO72_LG9g1374 [Vigna unguiculata]|uniref:Uncharacterized protein n=1 Tax=Vigna unguiculata TaxID=3917 RepID=A0A4D6N092_VIGUN|nr:hypothetical protein DEO72_LG9g1374 [Vigna unguiculata]